MRGSKFLKTLGPRFGISWPLGIVAATCFALGVWSLAYIQSAGDGMWYFYAKALLRGDRLYSDLHVVLQPAFVMLNALGIVLFGDTFLGQKAIFVVVLAAYIILSVALITRIRASGSVHAFVFAAFFFASTHFCAYRFDDYRALEDVLTLAVVIFALRYMDGEGRQPWTNSVLIGSCLGFALLTRINDGVFLFAAVSVAYFFRRHPGGIGHYCALVGSIVITAASVFVAIGDSIGAWAEATIFSAAAVKGGGAGLLTYPSSLIKHSITWVLANQMALVPLLIQWLTAAILTCFIANRGSSRILVLSGVMGVAGYALIVSIFHHFDTIYSYAVVAFLATLLYCVARFSWWFGEWRNGGVTLSGSGRQVLFLIPIGLYFSGSMSTGGYMGGVFFPLALVLAIWCLTFDKLQVDKFFGALAVVACIQIAVFGAWYKQVNPYSWNSYNSASLFKPRALTTTEKLGKMPIEPDLLKFIEPICAIVAPANEALLSVPFPYANYFCGVPLWKGHVQLFFDTTPKSSVDNLIADLNRAPPRYILYQREMDLMRRHEIIYHSGNPLPQRALDVFILRRIESGHWKIVYATARGVDSAVGTDILWLLIDTSEARTLEETPMVGMNIEPRKSK